jgi:co-chaperonin GroES (HSP10)
LVELTGDLQFVEMPDKQYATNTTGKVIAIALGELDYHFLMGKQIYFEGFKDVEVTEGEDKFAFVKIEDIRGFKDVETSS